MAGIFAPRLLEGRAVLITGGSSGINRRIAERFAAHGAKIAVVGRDGDRAAAAAAALIAAGGEAVGISADVRDMASLETACTEATDRFGPLDIVVAGAAGNFVAPALGMSSNGFRTVVDIDLVGTFNTLRAAHAHLRKPGSAVLAISAVQAQMPTAAQAHVCAAKAGVEMLMRTLAVEWASDGIRSLAIAPGPVDGTEGMRRLAPGGQDHLARMLAGIPSGRQAGLDEIADLALFLVSGAADYINGTVIHIDGGFSNLGSRDFGALLTDAHRSAAAVEPQLA